MAAQAPQAWAAERDAALRTLDLDWARRMAPGAASDEVRLVAMHKARACCAQIPRELRLASVEWLRERGLCLIDGLALPAPGELPR